jgi:hypothetical protein
MTKSCIGISRTGFHFNSFFCLNSCRIILRNPVIATTESAGSRPVIPNDGDRKFRTMATTPRSEATLVY